ncbi:MAG: SDR family oxidoreductase [Bacteroidaceae bacterium]|nr:SDR family oxidoreductase [Bacteroidaceae bacterium]
MQSKNVIITGCNRGIGKAMVEAFASSGANVWACARKATPEYEAWLKETAEKTGVWIKPVYFELTDTEAINAGMQTIIDEGQSIDVLVNNAGISTVGLLSMSKVEDIEHLFAVNYFAMLRIIQKVSKKMARQRKGCIINMGSIAGIEPQPGKIAYGSSKAAVMMMTKCLAKELGPMGIRVNAIAPGPIETEMIRQYKDDMLEKLASESSLRRLGKKEEIAQVALFLASEQASYINGEIIKVDGGR